jgi:hypothetical protein
LCALATGKREAPLIGGPQAELSEESDLQSCHLSPSSAFEVDRQFTAGRSTVAIGAGAGLTLD